jgi:hypothetical protein
MRRRFNRMGLKLASGPSHAMNCGFQMSPKKNPPSRKEIPKREGIQVADTPVIYAGIAFCMMVAGVGLFTFLSSIAPWFWESVPCEVLDFSVHDDPGLELPFSAEVSYRFEWEGRRRESSQVGVEGWKDARFPLEHMRKLSESPETVCYLPEGSPESAVLFRPQPKWGALYFIGFGVCMGCILYQAHRTRHLPKDEVMKRVLPPFALLVGLPGVLLTLTLSVPVWIELIQARGWTETPAGVVWSELRETRNRNSTNYRADVCYEYQIAGKTWRNNRVRTGFLPDTTLSAARGLQRSFPVGREILCYVDPTRPERAVLLKWPGWQLLLTLFPLPLLAIGLWVGREALRNRTAGIERLA